MESQPVSTCLSPGVRGVFQSYKKKDRMINTKGTSCAMSDKQ